MEEDIYVSGITVAVKQIAAAMKLSAQREYLQKVLLSLDRFGKGQAFAPFSFYLVQYEGRDVQYLRFSTRGDSVTLSEGGYVYDSAAFGDIYGDWNFTLWQNGDTCGAFRLNQKNLKAMLQNDPMLIIEEPDQTEI